MRQTHIMYNETCNICLTILILKHRGVYFGHGAPLASSVKRSRKKRCPKLKKVYHHERKRVTASKKRSHREIARISSLCSCDSGCLMRRPATESFELIRLQKDKHKELQQRKLHSFPANVGQTLCQWPQKSYIQGTINSRGLLRGV